MPATHLCSFFFKIEFHTSNSYTLQAHYNLPNCVGNGEEESALMLCALLLLLAAAGGGVGGGGVVII